MSDRAREWMVEWHDPGDSQGRFVKCGAEEGHARELAAGKALAGMEAVVLSAREPGSARWVPVE